jgi:glutamine synthetase
VKKDEAILIILRKYIIASKSVRFEGNGYSSDWEKEAEKRGLSNIKTAHEAFKAYISKKTINLYERNNILNKKELYSRYEIKVCEYVQKIQIESRVLGDLAINHIIPTAIKYQNVLITSARNLKEIITNEEEFKSLTESRIETIRIISEHIKQISNKVKKMLEERKLGNKFEDCTERIKIYELKVKPLFDKIRYHIDKLELIVDDEMWPLPKYRELLFSR